MIRIRPYKASDASTILSWCSDEKSFYAAIKYADLMIQNEVVNKIKEEFKNEENN